MTKTARDNSGVERFSFRECGAPRFLYTVPKEKVIGKNGRLARIVDSPRIAAMASARFYEGKTSPSGRENVFAFQLLGGLPSSGHTSSRGSSPLELLQCAVSGPKACLLCFGSSEQ
jgi:hypothetical protein